METRARSCNYFVTNFPIHEKILTGKANNCWHDNFPVNISLSEKISCKNLRARMNSACAIICAPTKIWQPLIRFMTNKALDRKNVPSACFSLILFFLNISQYFSYFSYFSILLIFRIFFIFRIFLNISHISQYLSMVVFFVYN